MARATGRAGERTTDKRAISPFARREPHLRSDGWIGDL